MKKSDLKTGMIVELKGECHALIISNSVLSFGKKENGGANLNSYNENMNREVRGNYWDIVKVYKEPNNLAGASLTWYLSNTYNLINDYNLLWERKEETILELDGIEYSESTLRSLIKKALDS